MVSVGFPSIKDPGYAPESFSMTDHCFHCLQVLITGSLTTGLLLLPVFYYLTLVR